MALLLDTQHIELSKLGDEEMIGAGVHRRKRERFEQESSLAASRDISKGITWQTAPEEAKKGLPPPPNNTDYSSEEYKEARESWIRRIGPILAIRVSALERSRQRANPTG
jgi:hypothetical protein